MGDTKWTMGAIAYQCGLAYVVSFIIYQLGHVLFEQGSISWGTYLAVALVGVILYLLLRKTKMKAESVVTIASLERG